LNFVVLSIKIDFGVFSEIISDYSHMQITDWIRPKNLMKTVMIVEIIKVMIVLGLNTYEEQDFSCYYEHVINIMSGNFKYDEIGSRAGGLVYPALHAYLMCFNFVFLSDYGMYFRPVQVLAALAYLACVYFMVKIAQLAFHKQPKRANILLLF
jgi:hypothetical protein